MGPSTQPQNSTESKTVQDNTPEAQKADNTELQASISQLTEATLELKLRRELRDSNLASHNLGEAEAKQLDSSVKRNSALIKRLRQLTDDAKESLLTDIQKTNQSKYVSEAAAAITEAPLKSKDINAAVHICSALHQRYSDFQAELIPPLAKSCTPRTDDDKSAAIKRRSAFKLLAELLLVGVYADTAVLLNVVKQLAAVDFQRDRDVAQGALSVLASFAKGCRQDVLGLGAQTLPAMSAQDAQQEAANSQNKAYGVAQASYTAELQQRFALASSQQLLFRQIIFTVYDSACQQLERDHAALLAADRENSRVLNNRGELPEDMSTAYERQRKAYETLQRTVSTLADALEKPMPDLPEPSSVTHTKDGAIVVLTGREVDEAAAAGPFEDEETRAFYESLPDLRAVVPAVLLGDKTAEEASNGLAVDSTLDIADEAVQPEDQPADASSTDGAANVAASKESAADTSALGGAKTKAALDALLLQLPKCISRELCDEASVNFCYMNSKAARKRLVRSLCENQRGNVQLLPFYTRIAATLSAVFADIGAALLKAQEDEFDHLQAKKDPTLRSLESRLRNARYLGELAKFRLAPFGTIFVTLKSLLDDFTHHNVDTACALLETAGRFLYRLPETHTRMANMAEVMMKLKHACNLDARQSMLVESAYYQCNPPQHSALKRKRRPVVQEWIRHLVFVQLGTDDVRKILRKLRKLAWAENERYLVCTMLKAVKGRFSQVPQVASLAAGLARYHPSLGVAFVDALLEEVRCGLEAPDSGTYQQRVGHMRLLGEMYNFRLVDSRVVFDTLYLLMSFGHESAEEAERLDPLFNYFRIRLVCTLLETCGQFFNKGLAKKRLDRVLAYFQRYLLAKPPLPLDVEFDVQDLLAKLRPSLQRLSSYEEAAQAVAGIEASEARSAAAPPGSLGAIEEEESDDENDQDNTGSDDEHGGRIAGATTEDDDGEGAHMTDQDDDDVRVKLLNPVKVEEVDEDFEKEFAALMSDFKVPTTASYPNAPTANHSSQGGASTGNDTVSFRVMMKRGGRDDKSKAVQHSAGMTTWPDMQLPANSNMALSIRAKAEAEEQERATMKRLVLQAHHQEEFDYVPVTRIKQTVLGLGGPLTQSGSPRAARSHRGHANTRASRGGRGG